MNSVMPLGGFNIGQAVRGVGQAFNQREQQRIEQEKTQKTQDLIRNALSGDNAAIPELYATNPQLGAQIESVIYQRANAKDQQQQKAAKEQTQQFVRNFLATPKEQRQALLERVSQDPNFSLVSADDDLLQMPPEAQDMEAKMLGYQLFGKDWYDSFVGGGEAFTLKEGETRFGPGGEVIASAQKPAEKLPEELTAALSPDLAEQANSAYSAAGGGAAGFKAYQDIVTQAGEQEKLQNLPNEIAKLYPNANETELSQLIATAQASDSPDDALKAASKLREEQRRISKAKTFKDRAVSLLDKILASEQLPDVIGSIEGAYDWRIFSDAEAEVISDIDEAQNILTAENMDLMTGVLSESDIKLLKNLSSGALNRKRSEDRFIKDVTELRDKLMGADPDTYLDSKVPAKSYKEGTVARNPNTGERVIFTNGKWEPYNG